MLARDKILESLFEVPGRAMPRSRENLAGSALRVVLALTDAEGAALQLANGRRLERFFVRRGEANAENHVPAVVASEFLRMLTLNGHAVLVPDLASDERAGHEDGCPGLSSGPALFVPIRLRENAGGYLAVYRARGAAPFTAEHVRATTLLAAWTTMASENLRLSQSVEKLAVTDDLTQVYNYRFLKSALRREIRRAGRFKQELSIIMIDVDNLKGYNDRHGHLRGSFLLREMAGLLSQQVRSWDLVAKYGGDEFTIILPQTGLEGAMVAAERLRAAVEAHTFPLAVPGQITISLGVATFPTDGDTVTNLIQSADRSLYLAKKGGRNLVVPPIRETNARSAAR